MIPGPLQESLEVSMLSEHVVRAICFLYHILKCKKNGKQGLKIRVP
jgi:hypothetical protein